MNSLGKDLLPALPQKTKTLSQTFTLLHTHDSIPRKKHLATSTNTTPEDRTLKVTPNSQNTPSRFATYGECGTKQQVQMTRSKPNPNVPSTREKQKTATSTSKPSAVNKKKRKPHVPKKNYVAIYNEYDRKHIWKRLRKQVCGDEAQRFMMQTKGWEIGTADMALSQWVKTLKKRRQKMGLHRVKIKAREEQKEEQELKPQCAPHTGRAEQGEEQVEGASHTSRAEQRNRVEDCLTEGEQWVELMAGLTVDGVEDYVEMMEGLNVG